MRFISKILGSWFILAAVITFVADFTAASASQISFQSTSIAEHWQALNKSSFEKAQGWISTKLSGGIWDWGLSSLLQIPTWAFMLVIGAGLFYLARKRTRIQIFAN